jgi:general secretion pathway protein F
MVEAGEKSGNLAEVLFQASQYLKSIADFRRKFLYILFYPAILSILALGVLVFLLKVMVPPYIEMYSGFHVEFPPSLKLLVTLEEFMRINTFWTTSIPAGIVAVIAVVLMARRSEAVRMLIDRIMLRIPIWGEMIREVVLASSFSTLTILLRSGVPLYESLKVAKDLVSNRPLRRAFELGADEVLEGQPFSVALVKQPIFPLEVAWVIRNGEARGDLIGALDKAKQTCQSKFEFSSQIILSVLEPAFLIMIGAIIVSIAASLFYPLYNLSTHFGP